MQKHVLIINTGGTIGMAATDKGLEPQSGHMASTLAKLTDRPDKKLPTYDLIEYAPLLDSANATPADWMKIAKDIFTHYDQYDGFLILHGTDTLAYTASALSFMLENLQKPVICTGSQIPLNQLRSDGDRNLIDSLYILNQVHRPTFSLPEVCIYFNGKLMRGNRSRKIDSENLNAFDSPRYPLLAEAGIDMLFYKTNIRSLDSQNNPDNLDHKIQLQEIRTPVLAYLQLFPGISDRLISHVLESPVEGLVLGTYGSGNAPNNHPLFLKALADATARGILILNVTQCLKGHVHMQHYATGNALLDAGVLSGHDMTPEAALTKLHYLLSKPWPKDLIAKTLSQNLRGELTSL